MSKREELPNASGSKLRPCPEETIALVRLWLQNPENVDKLFKSLQCCDRLVDEMRRPRKRRPSPLESHDLNP